MQTYHVLPPTAVFSSEQGASITLFSIAAVILTLYTCAIFHFFFYQVIVNCVYMYDFGFATQAFFNDASIGVQRTFVFHFLRLLIFFSDII